MNTENNILLDDSLRLMRIKEHPIQSDENLLIDDRLERGILRIYECTGGSIYILGDDLEMNGCNNVALVAELAVTVRPERREVKIDRIFSEYGYDFGALMKEQLLHFVCFYGYSLALLDLSKRKQCA